MIEQEPSRTAFAAAALRAAHQLLEEGRVFKDPLALTILGIDPDRLIEDHEGHEARRGIRLFVAARSTIAERALAEAIETRGVGQFVILGAGLDTFAYRNPFGAELRVFEADHPATQAWKRRRLAEAGIAIPDGLFYAPMDFERGDLAVQLAAAGLDPTVRTFFTWLGVVPYLTKDAIRATLAQIAAHPAGAGVAFDYGEPRERIDPALRAQHEERAARVVAAGEPFLSYFDPAELHGMLRGLGFEVIDDLDMPGMLARLAGAPPEAVETPRRSGGHVLIADTPLR